MTEVGIFHLIKTETKENEKIYQGTMRAVQHCQTQWHNELRRAATPTRAEGANHRVVIDGSKTHHLIANRVRNEDFARRWNHGDTTGTLQRAGGSRQLSNPGAIRGPQHYHAIVTAGIYHEEVGIVWGQRQATGLVELVRSNPPRSHGAVQLALELM